MKLSMKPSNYLIILSVLISCGVRTPDSEDAGQEVKTVYQIPTAPPFKNEDLEFAELMEKDQIDKNRVTADVLTYLLNDPEDEDRNTAAVIENSAACNIIVRFTGISNGKIYNLPVHKMGKNHFIIEKGTYTVKSEICTTDYYSHKFITEPLILKLPVN